MGCPQGESNVHAVVLDIPRSLWPPRGAAVLGNFWGRYEAPFQDLEVSVLGVVCTALSGGVAWVMSQ